MIVHGMQQKSHSPPPGQGHSTQPVFGPTGFTIDVVELLAVDGRTGLTSSLGSANAVMMAEAIFSLRKYVGDVRDTEFLKASLS